MNFKLFYIGEAKNMSAEEVKLVEEYIAQQGYAIVATSDKETGARVSGLNHLSGHSMQEICFATDSDSQKVKNMRENPVCELLYSKGTCSGQVILTGRIEVFTDAETKKSKWQDYMTHYFPDGPDGKFCVLKFKPQSVRAMLM